MTHSTIARSRALCASLRLPNLPSVVSNIALGAAFSGQVGDPATWSRWIAASSAGLLLCAGGNLLNDFKDIGWDRTFRPERALPQGMFQPRTYLILGISILAAAIWIAICLGNSAAVVCLGILIAILAYTYLHKAATWSVALVALCRGLLPLLGYGSLKPDLPSLPSELCLAALALMLHVIGLSISARRETFLDKQTSVAGLLCFLLAALAAGAACEFSPTAAVAAALLCYLLWCAHAHRRFACSKKAGVSALLAGISLVDLVPFAGFIASGTCPFWLLAFPVASFLLALALQRFIPAT